MRGAKGIVRGFAALGETRYAIELAQVGHGFASTRENFVRIRLMPDIPDNRIVRGVENVVQRNGQFDRSQVGRQMPPSLRDRLQDELAQLLSQVFQARPVYRP